MWGKTNGRSFLENFPKTTENCNTARKVQLVCILCVTCIFCPLTPITPTDTHWKFSYFENNSSTLFTMPLSQWTKKLIDDSSWCWCSQPSMWFCSYSRCYDSLENRASCFFTSPVLEEKTFVPKHTSHHASLGETRYSLVGNIKIAKNSQGMVAKNEHFG